MNVMQARTCIEEAHSHPSHPFSNDNSCMDFGFAFESDLVFSQFEFTLFPRFPNAFAMRDYRNAPWPERFEFYAQPRRGIKAARKGLDRAAFKKFTVSSVQA